MLTELAIDFYIFTGCWLCRLADARVIESWRLPVRFQREGDNVSASIGILLRVKCEALAKILKDMLFRQILSCELRYCLVEF